MHPSWIAAAYGQAPKHVYHLPERMVAMWSMQECGVIRELGSLSFDGMIGCSRSVRRRLLVAFQRPSTRTREYSPYRGTSTQVIELRQSVLQLSQEARNVCRDVQNE